MTAERRVHHRQLPSELVTRDEHGQPLFKARCACGWESGLVAAFETFAAWETHYRKATRRD